MFVILSQLLSQLKPPCVLICMQAIHPTLAMEPTARVFTPPGYPTSRERYDDGGPPRVYNRRYRRWECLLAYWIGSEVSVKRSGWLCCVVRLWHFFPHVSEQGGSNKEDLPVNVELGFMDALVGLPEEVKKTVKGGGFNVVHMRTISTTIKSVERLQRVVENIVGMLSMFFNFFPWVPLLPREIFSREEEIWRRLVLW